MKKISLIIAAVALIASSAQANTNKVETKAAGTTANAEASNNGAVAAKKPVAKAAEAKVAGTATSTETSANSAVVAKKPVAKVAETKNAVNSKETTVKQ